MASKEKAKEKSRKKLPKAVMNSIGGNIWLVQPTVLTMMRYDYTQMESKIFFQIIDKLQSSIKEAFNSYRKNRMENLSENSLFKNEEFQDPTSSDSITLKIPIRDFGVPAYNYPKLKEAFKTISDVPVEIEYKDKKGLDWQQFDHLCSVSIPKNAPNSHTEYVYVHIKKNTAMYMLSMRSGYTRYLKQTVLLSSNSYTPRFYTLLSLYKTKPTPPVIYLKDLRSMLCLEDKYSRFSDFKKRVLDVAYKDLKEMAANKIADFYFEYDKVYETGKRKAGEPMALKFTLYSNDSSGLVSCDKSNIELKRKYIYDILRGESILMDEKPALEICSRINGDNYTTIVTKLLDSISISRTKNYPKNYLYTVMMNEFNKTDSYLLPFDCSTDETNFTEYEEIEDQPEKD